MELRLILINQLVKLGLGAALAAALVRSVEFKSLLYREERSLRDRIYFVFWLVISEWIGKALAAGVWKFGATPSPFVGDLSLETTILLGALAGRLAGVAGGALLALPALFSGGWLTIPLYVVIGLVSGQLREFAPNHEEIWKFSPFNYLSLLRWLRRAEPRPSLADWQMMFLLSILAMRFLELEAARFMPDYAPEARWVEALIYATTVTVIVIEL